GQRGLLAVLHNFVHGRLKRHAHGVTPHPWPEDLIKMRRDRRVADESLNRRGRDERSRYWHDEEATRERALLKAAFRYLAPAERASRDPLFETLFVQYLRVKTALFRLLVHPPGERGLKRFLKHFTQIKVYAPDADRRAARAPAEEGLVVAAGEYPVAPAAWLANRQRADFPLRKKGAGRPNRSSAPSRAEADRATPL